MWQQACFGDSGSGLFATVGDNNWRLYGVQSRIPRSSPPCGKSGTFVVVHLTEDIKAWLTERILEFAGNNCSLHIEM